MAPMAFVIFLAALTLGYGSSTRQRGWLILGTVMEMLVLTFANPFRSSLTRGLIVINILLMAVALAGAATTTIVSELFQVETVEHMILADDAGCGMPENTTEVRVWSTFFFLVWFDAFVVASGKRELALFFVPEKEV